MMLETSKKVVELIQGTLRAGMNITPNGSFLSPIAPRGRLKNAKNQNWAKHKMKTLELPQMMLETSKKVVELIQETPRAGMNIIPNGPFLASMAPEGRLKNAKNQNWTNKK